MKPYPYIERHEDSSYGAKGRSVSQEACLWKCCMIATNAGQCQPMAIMPFMTLSFVKVKMATKLCDTKMIHDKKGSFSDNVVLEQHLHPVFCFDEAIKALFQNI